MSIDPEGVKVLLLADKVKTKTEGGIILPEEAKDSQKMSMAKGVVVAIGPSVDSEFFDGTLEVGDRVWRSKYSGVFLEDEDDGVEYLLVNDEDIFARIT